MFKVSIKLTALLQDFVFLSRKSRLRPTIKWPVLLSLKFFVPEYLEEGKRFDGSLLVENFLSLRE